MGNCLVTKLKGQVSNPDLRMMGETQFIVKAGTKVVVLSTVSLTCYAINGTTFNGGGTEVSGTGAHLLAAPDDTDVVVSIRDKYAITRIGQDYYNPFAMEITDEKAFDYYGYNESATGLSPNGIIDFKNKSFGYCPGFSGIGGNNQGTQIKNFNWESLYNGLSPENLPNLVAFGAIPETPTDIKVLGRLTSVNEFYFKPSQNWIGEINELCDALVANGKTNNFIITTCTTIKLNGVNTAYNKTVDCVYTDGHYVCTIRQ